MITAQTIRDALENDVIRPDGHGIYPPSHYEKYFDVSSLVTTYKSDGTPKGTIYTNGEPVDSLEGVYNLAFLQWLHRELDIKEYATATGRGFQAEQYVRLISQWANDN